MRMDRKLFADAQDIIAKAKKSIRDNKQDELDELGEDDSDDENSRSRSALKNNESSVDPMGEAFDVWGKRNDEEDNWSSDGD